MILIFTFWRVFGPMKKLSIWRCNSLILWWKNIANGSWFAHRVIWHNLGPDVLLEDTSVESVNRQWSSIDVSKLSHDWLHFTVQWLSLATPLRTMMFRGSLRITLWQYYVRNGLLGHTHWSQCESQIPTDCDTTHTLGKMMSPSTTVALWRIHNLGPYIQTQDYAYVTKSLFHRM